MHVGSITKKFGPEEGSSRKFPRKHLEGVSWFFFQFGNFEFFFVKCRVRATNFLGFPKSKTLNAGKDKKGIMEILYMVKITSTSSKPSFLHLGLCFGALNIFERLAET